MRGSPPFTNEQGQFDRVSLFQLTFVLVIALVMSWIAWAQ